MTSPAMASGSTSMRGSLPVKRPRSPDTTNGGRSVGGRPSQVLNGSGKGNPIITKPSAAMNRSNGGGGGEGGGDASPSGDGAVTSYFSKGPPLKQKQENPEDILLNRHYRLQGKPGLAGPGDGNIPREALSPAEANLLKSLPTYGEGLAGVAGLDLLMRVMVNAPDGRG